MILERLFIEGLVAPSIVPCSDGSVQIEWHKNHCDIELLVIGTQNVIAYRHNRVSGEQDELSLDNDFTAVAEWLKPLLVANQKPVQMAS